MLVRSLFLFSLVAAILLLSQGRLNDAQIPVAIFLSIPLVWGVFRGFKPGFNQEPDNKWTISRILYFCFGTSVIMAPFLMWEFISLNSVAEEASLEGFILGEHIGSAGTWVSVNANLDALRTEGVTINWMSAAISSAPKFLALFLMPFVLGLFDSRWVTFLRLSSCLAIVPILMQAAIAFSDPYEYYSAPSEVEDCLGLYEETETVRDSGLRDELEWEDGEASMNTNYYNEVVQIGKAYRFVKPYNFYEHCASEEARENPMGWSDSCENFSVCISVVQHNQMDGNGDFTIMSRSQVWRFLQAHQR